jgi:hypothetical protein
MLFLLSAIGPRSPQLRATPRAFARAFIAAGVILVVLLALRLPLPAQKVWSADDFVDSVGINIHLNYLDTPYANFPQVLQALQQLGVRHVRDGLIDTTWQGYYDRHNQLGRTGIKGIFITSPGQTAPLLLAYPGRMRDSFEAYEAPNEYDQNSDPNWVATLATFVTKLNQTVKNNSLTARFPVIGPSLTRQGSYAKLRGVCFFDFENLHNYFAGRNPGTPGWGANGYGSISWNLANENAACPGKPVMTTETGYQTDLTLNHSIPEEVAATYIPRIFLEQWLQGIHRTYLYELIDFPNGGSAADSGFGLLRPDLSSKPAYLALANLLHLLDDPGPSYPVTPFSFALTGDLSNLHHALFEKRDGSFYLAIWVEQPAYDVDRRKVIPVLVHQVVLHTDREVNLVSHAFDPSGAMRTASLGVGTTHGVEVSDSLTVLEIDQPSSATIHNPIRTVQGSKSK